MMVSQETGIAALACRANPELAQAGDAAVRRSKAVLFDAVGRSLHGIIVATGS